MIMGILKICQNVWNGIKFYFKLNKFNKKVLSSMYFGFKNGHREENILNTKFYKINNYEKFKLFFIECRADIDTFETYYEHHLKIKLVSEILKKMDKNAIRLFKDYYGYYRVEAELSRMNIQYFSNTSEIVITNLYGDVIRYKIGNDLSYYLMRHIQMYISRHGGWGEEKKKSYKRRTNIKNNNNINDNKKHPKWDKYISLCATIKNRKVQLSTMKADDVNRGSLVNEHNLACNMAKKMKKKYNF